MAYYAILFGMCLKFGVINGKVILIGVSKLLFRSQKYFHSHQQYMRMPISTHPSHTGYLYSFKILPI